MAGDVGKRIVTIEAVSGKVATAVVAAGQRLDVVQCGYCQSGQIRPAIDLLTQIKAPSDPWWAMRGPGAPKV